MIPGANQLFAAARDDEIDVLFELQQLVNQVSVFRFRDLERPLRHACAGARFLEDRADGAIGKMGLAAAAQDYGVARFDAKRRRVGGHIGPGLVNDCDHAERDARSFHLQTVRPAPRLDDLAHRIGERRHVPQSFGHRLNASGIERDAVEKRARNSGLAGKIQVLLVLFQEKLALPLDPFRHPEQRPVLLVGGESGEAPRRLFGSFPEQQRFFFDRHCFFFPTAYRLLPTTYL